MSDPADLRELVRAHVQGRRPVDAHERDSLDAFLRHFDALTDPFDEHADPVHVTASAIVVSARGVVLHRHKRLGIWLQPGGHIDAGEAPWDAARREAAEETGLAVTWPTPVAPGAVPPLVHVDVHAGPRGHTHLDLRYVVSAGPVDPTPPPGESPDVAWFDWPAAIAMADVGLAGVLRARQPGTPVVRRAVVDDARAAAVVHQRARRFATPGLPEVHDVDDAEGWMAARIAADEVWVADLGGVIVAEMILGASSPGPASSGGASSDERAGDRRRLDHLYVDPAWMGRGLGETMFGLARDRSPSGLQLGTHERNAGARR